MGGETVTIHGVGKERDALENHTERLAQMVSILYIILPRWVIMMVNMRWQIPNILIILRQYILSKYIVDQGYRLNVRLRVLQLMQWYI